MSIKANTNVLLPQTKFIARLSTMGEKKLVIYIPEKYHKDMLRLYKGKDLKVTVEEAIE
jgi:hypothetical protein